MRKVVFKNYDENFKKNIVKLFNNGQSVTTISKEYRVSEATIYSWIRKYLSNNSGTNYLDIHQENIKLKKEIEVLKQALTIMSAK